MSESTYNVDLLMQVREKIVNEPEKHYQQAWATGKTDRQGGVCDTSYCVAGWACALEGEQFSWHRSDNYDWEATFLARDTNISISERAQELLGLSRGERMALFAGANSREYVLNALDRLIEAGKNGERLAEGEL